MHAVGSFIKKKWGWIIHHFRRLKSSLQSSMRFIEFAGVVAALVAFYIDLDDRQGDRVNRAWNQITQASIKGSVSGVGNLGVVNALETLLKDDVTLTAIELNKVWLEGASLQGVNLDGASLHQSTLINSNLSNASLRLTNLSDANVLAVKAGGAQFVRTNLTGTIFIDVDMRNSIFLQADMEDAKFLNVALDGAHLQNALNLSFDQFKNACLVNMRNPPVLPAGIQSPKKECIKPDVWKMNGNHILTALALKKGREKAFHNMLFPSK